MKTIVLRVGEMDTNCYLAVCPETKKCLIIDPGDEANLISETIIFQKLSPVAIVATHGHFDHILSAGELQLAFEIPFLIHQEDEKIVDYMNRSAQWWLKREIVEQSPKIDSFLEDGQVVEFGQEKLTVLSTPGHSPGGICLFNSSQKILFSGDTLFKNGVGRTDLPYSSSSDLEKSLKLIWKQFAGYQVYPGHEGQFRL
ncbi:MAG: MBL fold metallo-hydrolase [Patescibacteria group bacterium]